MLPAILVAAAAATAAPAPQAPAYGIDARHPNVWNGVLYAPTAYTVGTDKAHRANLAALRTEALATQAQDGGTLSPAHRADLQHKLDRIQLRYAEQRRRADRFSVDASGNAVYSAATRPQVVLPPGITAQSVSQ